MPKNFTGTVSQLQSRILYSRDQSDTVFHILSDITNSRDSYQMISNYIKDAQQVSGFDYKNLTLPIGMQWKLPIPDPWRKTRYNGMLETGNLCWASGVRQTDVKIFPAATFEGPRIHRILEFINQTWWGHEHCELSIGTSNKTEQHDRRPDGNTQLRISKDGRIDEFY